MRLGPQDRAAERLVGEGFGLEVIEDDVVGRVFGLADFLDDDALLARQFFGIEDRVLQNVGENVDGERDIVLQHAGVIGGLFASGIGVDEAADAFDLFGDAAGGAALGALERHVLEHVSDAVRFLRLVARARVHPDADGGGFEVRHRVGDDGQAIGKLGETGGHSGSF